MTSHVLQNCGVGFRALFTGPGDVGGRLQQNISCSDPYLRGSCISTVHCAEIFTGVGSQDFLTGLVVDFFASNTHTISYHTDHYLLGDKKLDREIYQV